MTNIPHTRTTVQAQLAREVAQARALVRRRRARLNLTAAGAAPHRLNFAATLRAIVDGAPLHDSMMRYQLAERELADARRELRELSKRAACVFARRPRPLRSRPRAPRSARVRRAARRVDCDAGGNDPPEPPASSADRDGGAHA